MTGDTDLYARWRVDLYSGGIGLKEANARYGPDGSLQLNGACTVCPSLQDTAIPAGTVYGDSAAFEGSDAEAPVLLRVVLDYVDARGEQQSLSAVPEILRTEPSPSGGLDVEWRVTLSPELAERMEAEGAMVSAFGSAANRAKPGMEYGFSSGLTLNYPDDFPALQGPESFLYTVEYDRDSGFPVRLSTAAPANYLVCFAEPGADSFAVKGIRLTGTETVFDAAVTAALNEHTTYELSIYEAVPASPGSTAGLIHRAAPFTTGARPVIVSKNGIHVYFTDGKLTKMDTGAAPDAGTYLLICTDGSAAGSIYDTVMDFSWQMNGDRTYTDLFLFDRGISMDELPNQKSAALASPHLLAHFPLTGN